MHHDFSLLCSRSLDSGFFPSLCIVMCILYGCFLVGTIMTYERSFLMINADSVVGNLVRFYTKLDGKITI